MGIERTAERVVDFWRLLEFFTQDNYPKQNIQKKKYLKKIVNAVDLKPYKRKTSIEIFHSYKFNNFTEGLNEATNIENLFPEISSDVHLFVGKVSRNSVIEKLLELVKGEELIEENKSKICLFSLKMSKDNKYIPSSLCVSPLLWGTAIINSYGTDATTMKNKLTIDEYKKTITKIEENKKIFVEDQKVNSVFLRNLSFYIKAFFFDKLFDNSNIEEDITLIYNRFRDKEAYEKLNDSLEDYSNLINSFYQEDLEMVRKSIEQGKVFDRLFLDYICSGHEETSEMIRQREKNNVRNDIDLIESILCPTNSPLGKWPSEYNPAFMQQVAINQYISGKEAIFSVNGPPGTGKTTLLKEIVADNVVKRAKLLSQYKRADAAFKSEKYLDGMATLFLTKIIRCCESLGVIAPIALDNEPPRIGSDSFRQKRAHSITLPLQRYLIRAHYQGFASPISVDETGSVLHIPMCHVSADSSTNAHNQIIPSVAVPMSQTGIDARIRL